MVNVAESKICPECGYRPSPPRPPWPDLKVLAKIIEALRLADDELEASLLRWQQQQASS